MIKFKNEAGEFEITDEFEVTGSNKTWVEIIKTFVDFISTEFHPYSGDPFLILESELQKLGFKIIKVTTTYDPDNTY